MRISQAFRAVNAYCIFKFKPGNGATLPHLLLRMTSAKTMAPRLTRALLPTTPTRNPAEHPRLTGPLRLLGVSFAQTYSELYLATGIVAIP
jgi:hypothetical protein